ncbi:unnamed protein product (macronuclear) [Paramecium tetraurelia]|uniref:Trichohyalin-plectin-homology domain-containing protein n=1 Tax=Paramecium tetraurelia TaxID=5888 RepID=A0D5Z6_PARTE|nr:uncharacterized protein GSPATT00013893001 [Paramecium tetraurelia]CAK78463.1 unnamed protein product [Paramecium tetraurelia]|eukprot:XP_001445860.1 hypothetical protein (macronuclear) [Paramecium tetraurelia strain d4-2]
MILPIKYDDYREYDVNRQLHDQARDFRLVQQELLKQQLQDQQLEMERRKRSLTTQKQREELLYLENLRKEKEMQYLMEGQNKQFIRKDLSKWYENSLTNQRINQEQLRQERQQIEQQIIDTAKQGQTMAESFEKQKKDYYRKVQDQQYGQVQIKKMNEMNYKKFDQAVYQEQVHQENTKIQRKLDNYKQYYQNVQNRQQQLQAMYLENYRDPKQGLDDIISKNVLEKQQQDEKLYRYQKELEDVSKEKYSSILSIQLQEQQQKRRQNRNEVKLNGYQQANSVYWQNTERQTNISTPVRSVVSEQNQLYNPLTNPNPNQTQNPYILKQLGMNLNDLPTPAYTKSKLASMGKFCMN